VHAQLVDTVRYQSNFLTQVILRLDFPSIPALLAERQPQLLVERLRERFPALRASQAMQVAFMLGSDSPSGMTQSPGAWTWHHGSTQEFKKAVAISHNFLSLEYAAGMYVDAAEFLDNFQFAYRAVSEFFRIDTISRLGWRYINDIVLSDGDALNWDGIVKKDFITAALAGLPHGMQLTRSMHQLNAAQDDISLVLSYGLFNPEYPNPVARRSFIIDLDFSVAGDIRWADAHERAVGLNRRGEALFESIIDNELRKIMGVIQ
jgi:uncharacterized protein (TIGR04255 family)